MSDEDVKFVYGTGGTTRRIDKDGNEVISTSIDTFPLDLHDRIKTIARAEKYSVGNIYSDAIVGMLRDYENGRIKALLNPLNDGGRVQVWLRDDAREALQELSTYLKGEYTAVIYTAMVRKYGWDQLEK